MAEFARGIVARLRQFVGDRRNSKRQKVRLALSISVASPARSLNGTRKMSRMDGHTVDISANGMALIVPAIRIGEHHLVGENRNLNVNLELPVGAETAHSKTIAATMTIARRVKNFKENIIPILHYANLRRA